jgi:ATP-dependent RNA helicase DHX57
MADLGLPSLATSSLCHRCTLPLTSAATVLQDFQVPELQRVPLAEICLQAKLVAPNTPAAAFLGRAIQPPEATAIAHGVARLRAIGALAADERVTALGRHLAALPLDPLLGRLLLYGILFGCLDPILTVACVMAYRCGTASIIDVLPIAVAALSCAAALVHVPTEVTW